MKLSIYEAKDEESGSDPMTTWSYQTHMCAKEAGQTRIPADKDEYLLLFIFKKINLKPIPYYIRQDDNN